MKWTDSRTKLNSNSLPCLKKFPMAFQKVNAIFSTPERKTPGSGGIFSIFVSDLCKGCAACVTACGDHQALRMVQETEQVNAEHETGTAFLNLLPERFCKAISSATVTTRTRMIRCHVALRIYL